MKFKVGDVVVTTVDSEVALPIGTVGIVVQVDEKDYLYPYQIEDDCGLWYWYSESDLAPISERSEETEIPKQKDLYNFDNMTDDDLEMLINRANEALMDRKKDRLMTYLDDALNALREFQVLDHNTAITSNGNTVEDIIYDLEDLENYYN